MRFTVFGKSSVLFLVLFLAVATGCLPAFVCADPQSSAGSEIALAQNKLVECYHAATVAEAAGANISSLTSKLNEAGSLFSQAEFAYSSGNFSGAYTLAFQSQNELSNFVYAANLLQSSASQKQSTDFLLNFVVPIIVAFAIIDVSAAVYVLLKHKYARAGEK
jgi:hypothetical protein